MFDPLALAHSGLEVTDTNKSHAGMSARPTHANIDVHGGMSWFWPLLRLRARIAKHASEVEAHEYLRAGQIMLMMLSDSGLVSISHEIDIIRASVLRNATDLQSFVCEVARHQNLTKKRIRRLATALLLKFRRPDAHFPIVLEGGSTITREYRQHIRNVLLGRVDPYLSTGGFFDRQERAEMHNNLIQEFSYHAEIRGESMADMQDDLYLEYVHDFVASIQSECGFEEPENVLFTEELSDAFGVYGLQMPSDVASIISRAGTERVYEFDLTHRRDN